MCGRQQNFLDMVSKILSVSNRSRLAAFIRGEPLDEFRPVTVTLDPTLNCNANCPNCIERTPMAMAHHGSIPWPHMQKLIPELRVLGVRAIQLYGGEPTCYPRFAQLVKLICDQGLRLAIVTNGSLLHRHLDALMGVQDCLSWLRISINAGASETHQRTFRLPKGTFERILTSAKKLADRGLHVAFSLVVTHMNYGEISQCAQRCKQVGGQYLQLKPSVDPDSKQLLPLPAHIRQVIEDQVREAQRRNVGFQIILTKSLRLVLEEGDKGLHQPKNYPFCPATLFRVVISPLSPPGQVLSCPYHRASPKHILGSLAHPLDEAWLQSEERLTALTACDPRLDCGFWCSHHTLNQLLWELRRRYEVGEDVLVNLPVTNHPGDCWL